MQDVTGLYRTLGYHDIIKGSSTAFSASTTTFGMYDNNNNSKSMLDILAQRKNEMMITSLKTEVQYLRKRLAAYEVTNSTTDDSSIGEEEDDDAAAASSPVLKKAKFGS